MNDNVPSRGTLSFLAGVDRLRFHGLKLLVDPGGGAQIEVADFLFVEAEPDGVGGDPRQSAFSKSSQNAR